MARWELMTDHYLKVIDCEWEYNETDTETGRSVRKRYQVPEYLDAHKIVCWEGKGERKDIVFFGDPTPDMMPLDDEAREVSASFEDHWAYKPDTAEVPASQSIVANMAEVMSRPVEIPGLSDLVAQMAATTKTNQDLVESFARLKVKL